MFSMSSALSFQPHHITLSLPVKLGTTLDCSWRIKAFIKGGLQPETRQYSVGTHVINPVHLRVPHQIAPDKLFA